MSNYKAVLYRTILLCGYSPVRVATPFYTVRKYFIVRRLKGGCCPSENFSFDEGRNSHTILSFALFIKVKCIVA